MHGEHVVSLRGHEGSTGAVRFRAGGAQVVSGGTDGTVRVWDLRTGELLMTYPATDGVVSYVDVDTDGRILKSAENQHALRLLSCDVCGPLNAVLQLARARSFRVLTPNEERRFSVSS